MYQWLHVFKENYKLGNHVVHNEGREARIKQVNEMNEEQPGSYLLVNRAEGVGAA